MRLFIAIRFDEQTTRHMLTVQKRLQEMGYGTFSHPENLHLTLAFLGEIEPKQVKDVRKAMDAVSVPSLALQVTHTGCFQRHDGTICWLGLAPTEDLSKMQKELCERLRENGFYLENRRFFPHVTLARRFVFEEKLEENTLLAAPFCAWFDTIYLMQSERLHGKLTYSEIYRAGKLD